MIFKESFSFPSNINWLWEHSIFVGCFFPLETLYYIHNEINTLNSLVIMSTSFSLFWMSIYLCLNVQFHLFMLSMYRYKTRKKNGIYNIHCPMCNDELVHYIMKKYKQTKILLAKEYRVSTKNFRDCSSAIPGQFHTAAEFN